MQNQLLTDEELQEVTGAVRTNIQAEILGRHGVFFIVRNDGKIRTTWYHINHPLERSKIIPGNAVPAGVDFSSVEN
ncbi:DUF4224 domain-containing protein [Martelella alba]|uniref:DUF4224 domain-containing protein n=1 Tax=Martelella alba TaxID=2590451 RepID=A0ABY2SE89_9HYPH|nr:DUF4224 domain-containing protein [Martelella alba]TKI02563.1 DUF4224 domain-containing protein [Martelella alba]